MSSEECKKQLIDWFPETKASEWKRIAKRGDIRTFTNKRTSDTYHIYDDNECYVPAGDVLYYIGYSEEAGICVSFNPLSYWQTHKCLWDQHYGYVLETIYRLPSWIAVNEVCENMFAVEGKTIKEIEEACRACGFIQNSDFDAFMSKIEWH